MRVTALIALSVLVALTTAPAAFADRAFTTRYSASLQGDIRITGNQVLSCPVTDVLCATARTATSGGVAVDNDSFVMTRSDVDSDSTTVTSSRATLSLPTGAVVRFAGLYWGGDVGAGTFGTPAPEPEDRGTVRMTTPLGAVHTLTGAVDLSTAHADRYAAFADVTSEVTAAGSGSYLVADIQTATGFDRYGGWSLVVAYEHGTQERDLRIVDGLGLLSTTSPSLEIGLTGLLPTTGADSRVGLVAFEGDIGRSGDTATLNGASLTSGISPENNIYNSSVADDTATRPVKSPDDLNTFGLDADLFRIDDALVAGAPTTTIRVASPNDELLPVVVTAAIDRQLTPPGSGTLPAVSGTARDFETLTATDGTWTGSLPQTKAPRWQRCDASATSCTDISGATGWTRVLTSEDVGYRMRVVVRSTNPAGYVDAASPATTAVTAVAPVSTVLPAVTGTPRDAQTLTTSTGTFTGSTPMPRAVQWQRCTGPDEALLCGDVAGANAASYALLPADVGYRLRTIVTATNAAGSATVTSAATSAVDYDLPASGSGAGAPAISGLARDGDVLTASNGTWTGTPTLVYSHQWRRCNAGGDACADIPGATSTTYEATPDDVGSRLRIVVTATNAGGTGVGTSAATALVAPRPPAVVEAPAVGGAFVVGGTVTRTLGTWSGTPAISYTTQWQRCSLVTCSNLTGQTGPTYDPVDADAGFALRVVITATNGAGPVSAGSPLSITVASQPAANTSAPVITGLTQDGQTLTADRGAWTGSPPITYTYQWRRCDTAGANCADIAGASGVTYNLVSADVGSRLRVSVTATNGAGPVPITSSETATVVPSPPAGSTPPAVGGALIDGGTATANVGSWTGTGPLVYTYAWLRCDPDGANCVVVTGETSAALVLGAADLGRRLRVRVTATGPGGVTTVESPASSAVAPRLAENTTAPALSGTPRSGQVISATTGIWSGTPEIVYSYRWQRCAGGSCEDITGANQPTYALTDAEVGKTVRVVVAATNGAGTAFAASAESSSVLGDPPANTALPALTGTTRDGEGLTTTTGSWTGSTPVLFSYAWQRCEVDGTSCVTIPGATGSTYVLTAADVARKVRVQVTGTNGMAAISALSALTPAIDAAPPTGGTPTIGGQLRDGGTATSSTGTWSGTGPLVFARQWLRCNGAGTDCTTIAGATGDEYAIGGDDLGHRLRLRVTATGPGGSATAESAASTVVTEQPPGIDVAPTVSGLARSGEELTATDGTYTGTAPIVVTRRWQRCTGAGCTDIAGATGPAYTLTDDDIGRAIRVVVTAANGGGTVDVPSEPSAAVMAIPLGFVAAPQVTEDGSTRLSSTGTWTGSHPRAYAYQWQRCDLDGLECADLSGATGAAYNTTNDDISHTLRVRVTATNAAGSATATSAKGPPILPSAPAARRLPAVGGSLVDGGTAVEDGGEYAGTLPITETYEWLRCSATGTDCAVVAGATTDALELGTADLGHRMRIRVTVTNLGGTLVVESPPSAIVGPRAPAVVAVPVITGTPRDGLELTTTAGTFSGTAPVTTTLQWRRCATTGSSCADITDATEATYRLTSDDIGKVLRVRALATNAAGEAIGTSTPTDPVGAIAPTAATPQIPGVPAVDQDSTAVRGTWTGSTPLTFTYQWLRCDAGGDDCVTLPGATALTYRPIARDTGRRLRISVTGTTHGLTASGVSNPSAVVTAPVAPAVDSVPQITGTSRAGEALAGTTGVWTGSMPMTFARRWLRCGADGEGCVTIAGATGEALVLSAADVGRTLRLRVAATNVAGGAESTSAATAVVAAAPVAPVAPVAPAPPIDPTKVGQPKMIKEPVIIGTQAPGNLLTATPGEWNGEVRSFKYQWMSCSLTLAECGVLKGETTRTYLVKSSDSGRRLAIVVSAVGPQGDETGRGVARDPEAARAAVVNLSGLPGNLAATYRCAQVAVTVPAGVVAEGIVDRHVTAVAPLLLRLTAPAARGSRATLDGGRIRIRRGVIVVKPTRIRRPGRHQVLITAPGQAPLAVGIASANCGMAIGAIHRNRALLLRADAIRTITQVAHELPAAVVPLLSTFTWGELRVVRQGSRRVRYPLRPSADGRLLSVPGGPQVVLSGNVITISGLPLGAGMTRLAFKGPGLREVAGEVAGRAVTVAGTGRLRATLLSGAR